MSLLRKFFIFIAVTVLLLVTIGFFLPQKVLVERNITINAPIDSVFVKVNNFQEFNTWSPWFTKDPNAVYTYTGPDSGVGSSMAWESSMSSVGKGSQTILESTYPKLVKSELFFGDDPNPGYVGFDLTEISINQTEVSWTFETDFGNNPVGRWMGLFMDSMLGTEYETGLNTLKNELEK